MILDELENLFGKFTQEEQQWVKENLTSLDEEHKNNLIQELNNAKGKPSIQFMKIALQKVTGQKVKTYYWAVCLECGCEYDYSLPMCPMCYEKGLDCRTKAIRKSEFKPNFNVIKYNKTYLNGDPGEQTCFTCPNKKESYCKNFGNPDWMCHREEYEMCECKQCCGLLKSANRKLVESSKDKKFSYAVPLKRCI